MKRNNPSPTMTKSIESNARKGHSSLFWGDNPMKPLNNASTQLKTAGNGIHEISLTQKSALASLPTQGLINLLGWDGLSYPNDSETSGSNAFHNRLVITSCLYQASITATGSLRPNDVIQRPLFSDSTSRHVTETV